MEFVYICLKIPMGLLEAGDLRGADNTMTKKTNKYKRLTMVHKQNITCKRYQKGTWLH
jgi:hypothetical protein